MALLHSLRKGLQLVKSNKSPEKAEECFNLLKDALLNRNDVNRPGIDVIIICAEAALQVRSVPLLRKFGSQIHLATSSVNEEEYRVPKMFFILNNTSHRQRAGTLLVGVSTCQKSILFSIACVVTARRVIIVNAQIKSQPVRKMSLSCRLNA